MDLVTHVVVGAALGELALGKELGRRALLYGALVATLPDADILLAPFQDDISLLTNHRGLTHCLAFVVVVSLMFGPLLATWTRPSGAGIGMAKSIVFVLACLLSHVMLDACTTYGTPLLLPWSDYRVAFNTLFIIDPLFTLPLVVSAIVCLILKRSPAARWRATLAGVAMSCLYLAWTGLHKHEVEQAFSAALAERGIPAERFMTAPTPLNNVLWYCVAETADGYYVGYHSLFNAAKPIEFNHIPRHGELLAPLRETRLVNRLIWFSDGYYAVSQNGGQLVFDVLKFGRFPVNGCDEQGAFSFVIVQGGDGLPTARNTAHRQNLDVGRLLATLWRRIWGTAPSPAVHRVASPAIPREDTPHGSQ